MRVLAKLAMAAWAVYLCAPATARVMAADAKGVDVKVGDPAPVFEGTDDQGQPWKSTDHVGKKVVVVYFYPADFTGGCTKQACTFRDDFKKLADQGIDVVGVSGDAVKNHELFKKHYHLPFTLLADEHGTIAKEFGVPLRAGGEVQVKDPNVVIKRGVTISRWTFVIGKDGKVVYKNDKVSPAEDSKQILAALQKLDK